MGVFERQRQPCICFSWSCAALHHHSDHDPRMYTWTFITQCWQNEQEEHVPFNQLKILSRGPGGPFDWSLLHTATSPSMLSLKANLHTLLKQSQKHAVWTSFFCKSCRGLQPAEAGEHTVVSLCCYSRQQTHSSLGCCGLPHFQMAFGQTLTLSECDI